MTTEQRHLRLMLALTFTTGMVDAVGYLGLDRVFTGNMTGNVVILGMALVGGNSLPILGPFLALGGFMAGAALGGRVLKGAGRAWSARSSLLFGAVGVVILALGALLTVVGDHPARAVEIVVTTTLGAAMGVQAATARVVAVKDVTTVVVTSTITGLAADSVLGSGAAAASGGGSGRRALAVVLILGGAATGAALLRWHLAPALFLAGLVELGVALAGRSDATGVAAEAG